MSPTSIPGRRGGGKPLRCGSRTCSCRATGGITAIPPEVFAVSGYRALPRWLQARRELPADFRLVGELRDICARIAELIDLFARADHILDSALHEPLSREALGLEAEEPEASDGSQ